MLRLHRIELPSNAPCVGFPFGLPLVRRFERLELSSPVTFFTGENGSDKSTLLEVIAASAKLPTVGGGDIERDETLQSARELEHGYAWAGNRGRGGDFCCAPRISLVSGNAPIGWATNWVGWRKAMRPNSKRRRKTSRH